MTKSDIEQLKGILEMFDKKTIKEAVSGVEKISDIGMEMIQEECGTLDLGATCKVEEDESIVELEDLGFLERIIFPENNLLPVHFLEE